jgi:hypothetical protein
MMETDPLSATHGPEITPPNTCGRRRLEPGTLEKLLIGQIKHVLSQLAKSGAKTAFLGQMKSISYMLSSIFILAQKVALRTNIRLALMHDEYPYVALVSAINSDLEDVKSMAI